MKNSIFTFVFIALFTGFASAQESTSQDTTIVVNGVCGMCQSVIEGACELEGVESASWSSETKILQLTYKPTMVSLEEINTAINEAGYDTEYSTAPDEAYDGLHACCHYRDPEVQARH